MPPMYYGSEPDLHTRYYQILRDLEKEIGDGYNIEMIPNKMVDRGWDLFYQDLMITSPSDNNILFLAEMRGDNGQEEFAAKVISMDKGDVCQHPLEYGATVREVINKLKAKGLIEMRDDDGQGVVRNRYCGCGFGDSCRNCEDPEAVAWQSKETHHAAHQGCICTEGCGICNPYAQEEIVVVKGKVQILIDQEEEEEVSRFLAKLRQPKTERIKELVELFPEALAVGLTQDRHSESMRDAIERSGKVYDAQVPDSFVTSVWEAAQLVRAQSSGWIG